MTATAATSPASASTTSTISGAVAGETGATVWSNGTSAFASDNVRATAAALLSSTSQYLYVSNFSFAVPTNAVISGIKVEIEKSRTAGTGTLVDTAVRLVRRGVIMGENRAAQGAAWTGSDVYSSYGAIAPSTGEEGDLWGVPWAASDINSFDFGVVFSCSETAGLSATAGVDHIRVTIDYVSGYLHGPQVQEPGEVFLFGQRYKLAVDKNGHPGTVKMTMATQFSQKLDVSGPYSRPTNAVVDTYEVDDLRGGMGLLRYQDYPKDGNRFWTSQNMNTMWAHAATVAPAATSLNAPAAGVNGPAVIGALGGIITTGWDTGVVYTHNGAGWSALIDTLPHSPTGGEITFFNDTLFYALNNMGGTSGYSYQTNIANAATDVAAPNAQSFCVWDNKLYAIDSGSILYSSTTGLAASWTTLAAIPFEDSIAESFVRLIVYRDLSGDPAIWGLTSQGPYLYDAVSNKWFKQELTVPHWNNRAVVARAGAVFNGSLYVQTDFRKIMKLTMDGGGLTIERAHPWFPDGFPSELDGSTIENIYASPDLLFVTTEEASGANALLAYTGAGWHCLYLDKINLDSAARMTGMYATRNTNGYRLWFETTSGSDGVLKWIDLSQIDLSPLLSTIAYNNLGGQVEFPIFDANFPSQTKIAQQVRLKLKDATDVIAQVQVAYRINGSTGNYTDLGNAVGTDNETIIPFGTNSVGLEFKSIQFKLTFTASTGSQAPKLENFAMDFVRQPEVLRGYDLTIDCGNPYFNRSPQQQIDAIWAHMKATTFGTFAWLDDAGNTRSSLVKVLAPVGEEQTGSGALGTYNLHLVEMGPNV